MKLFGQRWLPYCLIAPAVLFMAIVHLFPMIVGALISFFKLNVMTIYNWSTAPFVGLRNYLQVLDPSEGFFGTFLSSLGYTFAFVVCAQVLCYILGMGAALLLNEFKFRGRNVVRGIFLFPYVLPAVVGVVNWKYMFSFEMGMVNVVLQRLGIISEPVVWLAGPNSFWAVLIPFVWLSWPFWFIVLLASLQTISAEYYEVASIDGASPWQKFRYIVVPMTSPVTTVVWLLTFMWYFREFTVPYTMLGLSPSPQANLLALHIYTESFRLWNFSQGAVMAVIMSIILTAAMLAYRRVGGAGNP